MLRRSDVLLAPLRDVLRDRHRHGDRRRQRACGRHPARRLEADAARLRAVPLLSRAVPEDHLLPGDDHVVRRRPRLQDRHGRDLLLLPGGAQRRRRHARDRQGADPRRPELPRQHLADGDQDLHAGDAPSDHQRHAAGPRRLPDRHAARRNQAVEPRRRLPGDPGLHAVRHAADVFAADRAVRDRDRRQCADRPPRRARHHQALRSVFCEGGDAMSVATADQARAGAQAADPPRALLRRQMAEAGDRALCRRDRARLRRVARQGRRRHRRRCRSRDRRRQGRIQGMAPGAAAGARQDAARHRRRAAQERRRAGHARRRRLRQSLCRDGARRQCRRGAARLLRRPRHRDEGRLDPDGAGRR